MAFAIAVAVMENFVLSLVRNVLWTRRQRTYCHSISKPVTSHRVVVSFNILNNWSHWHHVLWSAFQYRLEFSFKSFVPRSEIHVELTDDRGNRVTDRIKPNRWTVGKSYAFVVAGEIEIRKVASVRFTSNLGFFGSQQLIQFKYIKVTLMNDWSDRIKKKNSLKLCNFSTTGFRNEHKCWQWLRHRSMSLPYTVILVFLLYLEQVTKCNFLNHNYMIILLLAEIK